MPERFAPTSYWLANVRRSFFDIFPKGIIPSTSISSCIIIPLSRTLIMAPLTSFPDSKKLIISGQGSSCACFSPKAIFLFSLDISKTTTSTT